MTAPSLSSWYLCLAACQEVDLQPAPVHADRPKFTPASTSETGRKSSAGPETPPLTLFVPVGPCTPPVSEHELPHASCTSQPSSYMHNPTAADEGAEQRATSAAAGARAGAESTASRYDIRARDESPDEMLEEKRVTT